MAPAPAIVATFARFIKFIKFISFAATDWMALRGGATPLQ
jgi:hypothetical protein